jgi:hypothetical protein
MSNPIMKCGCAANATISVAGGAPLPGCGVHRCTEPHQDPPSLEGRTAFCAYGRHGERPSSTALAFFESHPDREHDVYYCGCFGWD